jgi:branched-subunit amino acid aminotransferase/4-amino-4-deoxychorismate lyase
MLNWQGYVAEGTISNIFLVKRGILYTPHTDTGILAGVTRELVLRLARKNRVPAREVQLSPKALLAADECFITNTTMEIMPVRAVSGKKIGSSTPGSITALLRQAYRNEVLACSEMQAS